MLLEIDINYLIQHQINAHQYIVLKLLNENDLKRLRGYLQNVDGIDSLPKDCMVLYKKGYLVNPPSDPLALSSLQVSEKFRKTLAFVDDPFEEFYKAFPTKVIRTDGNYDYLRIEQKRSRKIYNNIIRMNSAKHKYILKCLEAEVRDKTNRGQMSFFKRMPTWLTSEAWKVYADMVVGDYDSIQDVNEVAYGTDIE